MLFAIALGGALGSMLRYGVGTLVQPDPAGGVPVATLVVNVSGSFALGALVPLLGGEDVSPELRAALTVGLCGGYTTFSTFSADTVRLLEGGAWGRAGLYVLASVALSMLALAAGLSLSRALASGR